MNAAVPVIPGFILILVASVVFLKLVSYVHCNWDLRYLNLLPLTWLVDAQKWVCASHDMCLTEACTTWVGASHDMCLMEACAQQVYNSVFLDICLIDACTTWVGAF